MTDEAQQSIVDPLASQRGSVTMTAIAMSPPSKPTESSVKAIAFQVATRVAASARRFILVLRTAFTTGKIVRTEEHSASGAELSDRLAKAEGLLKERNRAVALTSHELRTPLNGILGMADLLAKTPLSPEQSTYVKAIATSSGALLTFVNDTLDAGKLGAGRWQSRPREVSPESLVEEVVELLAPRAQAKGLELAAHVAAQVPQRVEADPDQLTRILINLVGNAIKFTDRGGVTIVVSAEERTQTSSNLTFRVQDSGIGIGREHHQRIFQEYEQAGDGRADRPAGTGLGLAISQSMARAMDGTITLESTVGVGSVFCLRLKVPTVAATATYLRPLLGRHILLVSDRHIEPPVLMRRLFDLGASVELARTLDAARSSLATRRVDLILFDHSRTLDAVQLRNERDGSKKMPLAVMIAPADRHELNRLRAGGIDAHLVKPMRTASLVMVLSALLAGETIAGPLVAEDAKHAPSGAPRLKVLLADDNQINLLLGETLLKSLGHSVDRANNGAEAVECVTEAFSLQQPYDVVLMDLHMPVIDGFEAMTLIRQVESGSGHRALIIALTADVTAASSSRALKCGADHAITKPIQLDILKDCISKRTSAAPVEQAMEHYR